MQNDAWNEYSHAVHLKLEIKSTMQRISIDFHPPPLQGHGKLKDNFSPESDVTSLQDPFTSRPYKTPF